MRVLLFGAFGLLPLWAAIALIAYAFAALPSHEAGHALWVLVVVPPACAVTLGIASATATVHSLTQGTPESKRKRSAIVLLGSCVLLFVGGGWYAVKNDEQAKLLRHEQRRAVSFIEDASGVKNVEGSLRVSISSSSYTSKSNLPVAYDIRVRTGEQYTFYIVEVNRLTTPSSFRVQCTTPMSLGQRAALKGPCER
jgi:hypothetical protein